MNKQQAKELLNARYGKTTSPERIEELVKLVSGSSYFTTPENFERDLNLFQQSLMIDPDRYVYLIEEGIEDLLEDRYDNYELVDYGEKTLTYKCQLIEEHNGEDIITHETFIKFNKYTGEEIIK